MTKTQDQVRRFWNVEACGTHFVKDASDDAEFFARYRRFRYETEWHIPELVPFPDTKGKRVLEIGCGNGADGTLFADHGARYTGVDLTPTAVERSRSHFRVLGLNGDFQVNSALELGLADASFDFVYSHGVLHHTPDPARAIDEVHRVLKPGGKAVVMLYHRRSFNYQVRIMGYMRLRILGRILRRVGRWRSDRARAREDEVLGLQDGFDGRIWDLHYRNWLREGWGYLRARNFQHHATDGPECPYAFAYSKSDARDLFHRFSDVRFEVAHFPLKKYRFASWVSRGFERALARRLGWYMFVYATR